MASYARRSTITIRRGGRIRDGVHGLLQRSSQALKTAISRRRTRAALRGLPDERLRDIGADSALVRHAGPSVEVDRRVMIDLMSQR